jgi:hypothetical protein
MSIAREWLKAKGDPAREQEFLNNAIGLAYDAKGELPGARPLARQPLEPFCLPLLRRKGHQRIGAIPCLPDGSFSGLPEPHDFLDDEGPSRTPENGSFYYLFLIL